MCGVCKYTHFLMCVHNVHLNAYQYAFRCSHTSTHNVHTQHTHVPTAHTHNTHTYQQHTHTNTHNVHTQ